MTIPITVQILFSLMSLSDAPPQTLSCPMALSVTYTILSYDTALLVFLHHKGHSDSQPCQSKLFSLMTIPVRKTSSLFTLLASHNSIMLDISTSHPQNYLHWWESRTQSDDEIATTVPTSHQTMYTDHSVQSDNVLFFIATDLFSLNNS